MSTLVRNWSLRLFAASLAFATLPVSADDAEGVVRLGQAETTGVVRISDAQQSETIVRGQSCPQSCPHCKDKGCRLCPKTSPGTWLCSNLGYCCMRQQHACQVLKASCREDLREKCAFMKCKFGYFFPNGYPPYGCYKMVYPVDPHYFDQRDGQPYAAAGYGGPVAVPLAPVVEQTYNYGWGIPSSRLTRVAHPLTPAH